jgi:hypothetical protein
MKRIGVLAGDINNGLSFQRAHIVFKNLKHKYEFIPISIPELTSSHLHYLDALVLLHPYHSDHLRIAQRVKFQYRIPVIADVDDLITELPTDHPMYLGFKKNCLMQILSVVAASAH